MPGGELFAIATMVGAAAVGIAFLDFIRKRIPDALGEETFATTPWGEIVEIPSEAKLGGPAKRSRKAGGDSRSADRAAETQTITHTRPVSHPERGPSTR